MLDFCTDENFNNNIVPGLLRQAPKMHIVRMQDMRLTGIDDPSLLAWAAKEGYIILTRDVGTLAGFAFARVDAGLPLSGVFEVEDNAPLGFIIE